MKKILIALDYDPTAQNVADAGFKLAKTLGSEIVLLHVITDPSTYSANSHITIMGFAGQVDTLPLNLETIEGLKKTAQIFLDKSKIYLGDKNIQTLVGEGDFAESIVKTAKEVNADLIVMGSHSKKWLENIVMGSVTEKVLRHTTVPVFIIPTRQIK